MARSKVVSFNSFHSSYRGKNTHARSPSTRCDARDVGSRGRARACHTREDESGQVRQLVLQPRFVLLVADGAALHADLPCQQFWEGPACTRQVNPWEDRERPSTTQEQNEAKRYQEWIRSAGVACGNERFARSCETCVRPAASAGQPPHRFCGGECFWHPSQGECRRIPHYSPFKLGAGPVPTLPPGARRRRFPKARPGSVPTNKRGGGHHASGRGMQHHVKPEAALRQTAAAQSKLSALSGQRDPLRRGAGRGSGNAAARVGDAGGVRRLAEAPSMDDAGRQLMARPAARHRGGGRGGAGGGGGQVACTGGAREIAVLVLGAPNDELATALVREIGRRTGLPTVPFSAPTLAAAAAKWPAATGGEPA